MNVGPPAPSDWRCDFIVNRPGRLYIGLYDGDGPNSDNTAGQQIDIAPGTAKAATVNLETLLSSPNTPFTFTSTGDDGTINFTVRAILNPGFLNSFTTTRNSFTPAAGEQIVLTAGATGAPYTFLRVNGFRMVPTLDGKKVGELKEFPIPRGLVRDGSITLTFDPTFEPNLNWRVHRVWSLDWVRNRQSEVERLRAALTAPVPLQLALNEAPGLARERAERQVTELLEALDAGRVSWVKTYECAELDREPSIYEFHESINRDRQRDLVVDVLAVPAPDDGPGWPDRSGRLHHALQLSVLNSSHASLDVPICRSQLQPPVVTSVPHGALVISAVLRV